MGKSVKPLPRIIWTYWDQGVEAAPELIELCFQSWLVLNPDWEVRILDRKTISEWVNPAELTPYFHDLPIQKQADLLRLQLLVTYGGVWADPTVFCTKPLSDWLCLSPPFGFMMFENGATDRMMATWFIAGTAGNPLLTAWLKKAAKFFEKPRVHNPTGFLKSWHRALVRFTMKNEFRSRFWSTWLVSKLSPTYPYFIFHYLGGRELRRHALIGKRPEASPLLRRPKPRGLIQLATKNEEDFRSRLFQALEESRPLMFKLSHKSESRVFPLAQSILPELQEWVRSKVGDS